MYEKQDFRGQKLSYSHTESKTGFYHAKNQACTVYFKTLLNIYTIVFCLSPSPTELKREVLKHHSRTLFPLYLQQTLEAPRLQTALKVSNLIFIDSERSSNSGKASD